MRHWQHHQALHKLPHSVHVHRHQPSEAKEVAVGLLAQLQAIINAVEVCTVAEVLEGEDLVIEWHAGHQVIAVHNPVILALQLLTSVICKVLVAHARLPERVHGAHLAAHLGLAREMQHGGVERRERATERMPRDEELGVGVVMEQHGHLLGDVVVGQDLALVVDDVLAEARGGGGVLNLCP